MDEKEKCNIEKECSRSHKFRNSPYYAAAILMPSIWLFFLYNRNHGDNHIEFNHVLIFAIFFAATGLVIFMIFKYAVAGVEGALALSLMFWSVFWLFEVLLRLARIITSLAGPRRLMALLFVFFVIAPFVFRKLKSSLEKVRPVFNTLAVCLIAMFLVNLVPGVSHEISLARARGQIIEVEGNEDVPFYIKDDFVINPDLPSPDIYWIHADGLMSIETVESFWGLCYEHYREELERRGFLIYEGATLNAGSTYPALTSLLSPGFYDSFFGELVDRKATLLEGERRNAVRGELAQVGLTYAEDIMPYLELFHGLAIRGYAISTPQWGEMPTSFGHLVGDNDRDSGWWASLQTGYLPELLAMTTPLDIRVGIENKPNDIAHLEYGIEPVARFVWRFSNYAHMYAVGAIAMEKDPTLKQRNLTRVDLYPLGFERAIENALRQIDEILDRNPHAVIVLQSDHGFHYPETQQHLLEEGYSLEQVLELNRSVFSAVFIPPKYGGLEEPLAPLNISRELMNRFVGENYELLPSR